MKIALTFRIRVLPAGPGFRAERTCEAAILCLGLAILLSGCRPSTSATPVPTRELSLASATSTRPPDATSTPAVTVSPSLTALPSPLAVDQLEGECPADGNLLGSGGFASDLEGWRARNGLLRHTVKTYAGEPGAAMLVTSATGADGGKLAVAGRCVDLELGATSQSMVVQAYLLAMPETERVEFSIFFHSEAGCRGEVLDVLGPPAATYDSGWTFVSTDFSVPPGSAAADFVVRAFSQSESGRALVDRVCAYAVPDSG